MGVWGGLVLHGTAGSRCPQAGGHSVSPGTPAGHPLAAEPGIPEGEGAEGVLPGAPGGRDWGGGGVGRGSGPARSSGSSEGEGHREPRRVPPPPPHTPDPGAWGRQGGGAGPAGTAGAPLRPPSPLPRTRVRAQGGATVGETASAVVGTLGSA